MGDKESFDKELRNSYDDVKKLLGFKLVEPDREPCGEHRNIA